QQAECTAAVSSLAFAPARAPTGFPLLTAWRPAVRAPDPCQSNHLAGGEPHITLVPRISLATAMSVTVSAHVDPHPAGGQHLNAVPVQRSSDDAARLARQKIMVRLKGHV